jgi:hypothetical protein
MKNVYTQYKNVIIICIRPYKALDRERVLKHTEGGI